MHPAVVTYYSGNQGTGQYPPVATSFPSQIIHPNIPPLNIMNTHRSPKLVYPQLGQVKTIKPNSGIPLMVGPSMTPLNPPAATLPNFPSFFPVQPIQPAFSSTHSNPPQFFSSFMGKPLHTLTIPQPPPIATNPLE